MGTFDVYTNDFLKFEVGPSMDFQLQWATYRDASDQTSLSRIWGGIHPPIDDIPGTIIGEKIISLKKCPPAAILIKPNKEPKTNPK